MEYKEIVEMNVADTIMERPIGFKAGRRNFYIYPPTLGKTYLLSRLFNCLDANEQIININPYLEALRLSKAKKNIICRILAYSTFNKKDDIFDNLKVNNLTKWFERNIDEEELATLFVLILSGDGTGEYIKFFGLDKEREERKRIGEVKKDNGSLVFGGKSTYGTLIDFACLRYGWTMDYVVWGISYANLKMLIADSITTSYLSLEERKKLHIFDNVEYINGDDPANKELIRELLND